MKQLINRAELDAYVEKAVEKRCGEPDLRRRIGMDEFAAACAAIAGIVAKNDSCMRDARPEDIAKHDSNGALAMQAEIFGRGFQVFAPELDKDLEQKIRQLAVKQLRPAEARERTWRKEKKNPSGSSLAAAFNGATGTGVPASSSLLANPAFYLAAGATAAVGIYALAKARQKNENRLRRIEQLILPGSIEGAAQALGIPCGVADGQNTSAKFFRVMDGEDHVRGYFYAQANKRGDLYLRRCRVTPDILPDPVTCESIWAYAREAGMRPVPNAGETGIFRHGPPGHFIALQSLPQDFISDEALHLSGIENEFTLSNLKQINAPAGDLTLIQDCPNFTSLGDLEFSSGSMRIANCENFKSLGNLAQIGKKGAGGAMLSIINCPKLTSLGSLRYIEGGLYLFGTGINAKNFPAVFDHIGGNVHLDEGIFKYQGRNWHFPLKPVAGSLWGRRHG